MLVTYSFLGVPNLTNPRPGARTPGPTPRMSNLTVITGTDMQQLGEALADGLKKSPPTDVFLQDIILVDGKASSNWLTRVIVREGCLDVHMNAQLMNTRRFGTWAAATMRGRKPGRGNPLEALPARLYRLLGEAPHRDAWRKWSGVTDGEVDPSQEVVRWGLAFRLARHFQDLVRNDQAWIERAERGESAGKDDRWSPLWKAAIDETRRDVQAGDGDRDLVHDVDVLHALTFHPEAVANRQAVADRLPGRLTFFASGDVSATLLRTLKALSDKVPVTIYRLQPTEGLHDRMTTRQILESLGTDEEDVDIRNPALPLLLAAGRYYRLQFEKFEDILGECERVELPAATTPSNNLGELKRALRVIATGLPHEPSGKGDGTTPSLSIHRCHGPLREVEILRDQLLRAMQEAEKAGKPLNQGDILVLSPSPEVYGPLMKAVLGSRKPYFEVGTANIFGASSSPFGALVKALVELPATRVAASDIHSLLSMRALQARLGWGSDSLEMIRRWMDEAPCYWGHSPAHRKAYLETSQKAPEGGESAASDAGTLVDFMKRVALGTAVGDRIELIAGTLPAPGMNGRENLRLAKELMDVLEPLERWIRSSLQEGGMPVIGWVAAFREVAKLLPTGKDYVRENRELAQALQRIETQARSMAAAMDSLGANISHALFCQMLLDQCDFEAGSGQFLTGRLTLAPLRATSVHPARVIAFVGMSDGAFPAKSRGVGPEIAQEARPKGAKEAKRTLAAAGAGSQEDTSMHAFLLAVGAAKERVIATFDGYAGSTGKKASAALPVEILRRVGAKLDETFTVTYHALADYQAPKKTKDLKEETADARTFDESAGRVHAGLKDKKATPVVVPKAGGDMAALSVQEWAELWTQPVRSSLRALDIRIPRRRRAIDDQEPLEDNAGVVYAADDWLTRWRNDVGPAEKRRALPTDEAAIEALAKKLEPKREASGLFPPGDKGHHLLKQLMAMQVALEADATIMDAPLREILGTKGKPSSCKMPGVKLPKIEIFANTEHGDGVLALTVRREPTWTDCLSGLALLCRHDAEGRRYRKVTVLGLKGRNAKTKLSTLLELAERSVEVTDEGVRRLKEGLGQLARSPLAADMPLLIEILGKSFEACLPNGDTKNPNKPKDIRMDDLLPSKGRPTPHENRLVMPEQFNLAEFNRIARAMFMDDGAIRRISNKEDAADDETPAAKGGAGRGGKSKNPENS